MPTIRISHRPYAHRQGFRFRLTAGAGQIKWATVGRTEQEARELAIAQAAIYQASLGVSVGDLIDQYVAYLRLNDRSDLTLTDARNKLRLMLEPLAGAEVVNVTIARARARYLDLAPTCAAATHHEALKRTRTAWKWAIKQGITTTNPWVDVEPIGRPNRGKEKLNIDETNKLIDACLVDVDVEDGALAVLFLVFCGLRSSEILKRQVRDVDAGGTRLNIHHTKPSPAGERSPAIPAVLQSAVRLRTQGRATDEPLLRRSEGRPVTSQWLAQCLEWYCRRAGVPVVCPHALRGGWADIAYRSGEEAHRVAAALGHTSPRTTERHYASANAVEDARIKRRLGLLTGGKAD